jgi:hypothetical protein
VLLHDPVRRERFRELTAALLDEASRALAEEKPPRELPSFNHTVTYDFVTLLRHSKGSGQRELYFGVASVLTGRPRPPELVRPERYLEGDLVGENDVQFILDMRGGPPFDLKIFNTTNVRDFRALITELKRVVPIAFAPD